MDPEPRLFGTVERRLFRATAVLCAMVALLALVVGIVWVLGQVMSFFFHLVLPLSVAGILALVLSPVVGYIERYAGGSRLVGTSVVVLTLVGILLGALIIVIPAAIREVVHFMDVAPDILLGWQDSLTRYFPELTRMLMESNEEGELKEMMPAMDQTGKTVTAYVSRLVGLGFVPLFLFFILLSGSRLRGRTIAVLSVLSAKTQKRVLYFMDVFLTQMTGFFQGQLVIAVIMGTMFATGFTLIGLEGGILIGLTLGLLNIVPFLGTLIGVLVVLPLAYFQPSGGMQLLGLSLLVFTIVQLIESWLLTPRIMANRSGLHPALVVISVFFWGAVFGGITGMVLAVPLTAFLVAVWRQAKVGLAESLTADRDKGRIELITGTAKPAEMKALARRRP